MSPSAVERQVSDLYGSLWEKIGHTDDRALVTQFLYNVGLPGEWFSGKRSLDAGCGSGFAIKVLRILGSTCHSCDIGVDAVRRLRATLEPADPEAAEHLINASVLALPYDAESFDFVHCNGVLHHTTDPRGGFNELVRVTRPGGVLFVGIYGRGGLYNGALVVARVFARLIPYRWTARVLDVLLGARKVPNSFIPARVSVLDNLYVPIRHRYLEGELRKWFRESGFEDGEVVRTKTTVFDHTTQLNRIIHGQGYIQLRGRKPG